MRGADGMLAPTGIDETLKHGEEVKIAPKPELATTQSGCQVTSHHPPISLNRRKKSPAVTSKDERDANHR